MPRTSRVPSILGWVAALVLAGCSSAAHQRYAPRAIEQGLEVPGRQEPVARSFVAVVRTTPTETGHAELTVRLRVENLSEHPLTLDAGAITLVDAARNDLGPAHLAQDDPVVPPGAGRTFELTFLGTDDFDPTSDTGASLQLGWGLTWNGTELLASTEFRRQESGDGDGWWPPTWLSVGVGVNL